MLGRLFHCKSLEAAPPDTVPSEYQLRRTLGPVQLTLLGIGAIIGAAGSSPLLARLLLATSPGLVLVQR
jgi:hypothetical protein